MSKLERLIQQYCPDGVEYVRLGDVMSIQRGASPRPIQNYLTDDEYGIPWIKIGDVSIESKYITSTKERITKEGAAKSRFLKRGSFILSNSMSFGRPYILEIDGCIHDGWISMCDFEKHLLPDFLYYLLRSSMVQDFWISKANSGGAVTNLNSDIVRSTLIPVPPLPVQEEIVRILDAFTELQAELQAELQKRQQQYNFYRDNLLNFNRGGQEIKWMKLKEIGKVCMCKRILKEQTVSSGDVPFYKIGTFGGVADAYISQELFDSYKSKFSYPQKGDILISAAGTIGRTVEFDGKPAYFQDSNIVWLKHDESIVLNSYLKYCYTLNPWAISTGGTIARLYNDNILNATIPVPPIADQQKIVSILDRFDTLTNDLTSGLPAEMEKRRQQYEYYRDRLLTFKRL